MAKFIEIDDNQFINLDMVFCLYLGKDLHDEKIYRWTFEGPEVWAHSPDFTSKEAAITWFETYITPYLKK